MHPDFSAHFNNTNLGRIIAKDAICESGYDFTEAKKLFRRWVDANEKLYTTLADSLIDTAIDTWCGSAARTERSKVLYSSASYTVSDKGGPAHVPKALTDRLIAAGTWGDSLLNMEFGTVAGVRFLLKDATRLLLREVINTDSRSIDALSRRTEYLSLLENRLKNDTDKVGKLFKPSEVEEIALSVGYGEE